MSTLDDTTNLTPEVRQIYDEYVQCMDKAVKAIKAATGDSEYDLKSLVDQSDYMLQLLDRVQKHPESSPDVLQWANKEEPALRTARQALQQTITIKLRNYWERKLVYALAYGSLFCNKTMQKVCLVFVVVFMILFLYKWS